jgi:ferredoxin-NADP reductase
MEGVGTPQGRSARILARTWRTDQTFEIRLEKPGSFQFSAGQSVRLAPGPHERDCSLLSGPRDDHLALYVELVEAGAVSPFLARAEPGEVVGFSGPNGFFTFAPSERSAVFVATGTGIAPFVSMAG